mmetsp:Transcript_10433/g.44414  ORF Transcript_10433/g.44414 Transcript_10433/m.44414 type:complete len:202 (+) Transcript_10433:2148-2753(+)
MRRSLRRRNSRTSRRAEDSPRSAALRLRPNGARNSAATEGREALCSSTVSASTLLRCVLRDPKRTAGSNLTPGSVLNRLRLSSRSLRKCDTRCVVASAASCSALPRRLRPRSTLLVRVPLAPSPRHMCLRRPDSRLPNPLASCTCHTLLGWWNSSTTLGSMWSGVSSSSRSRTDVASNTRRSIKSGLSLAQASASSTMLDA